MRIDLDEIQSYISSNSHILDLGCGEGDLLLHLQEKKNITGVGLENDPNHIAQCILKGVNVVEHDLNKGLSHLANNSYDVVIMTLALQTMKSPDKVLDEMLRIGKECIITFPNFAYWKSRWHLLIHGRMPVSDLLPYEWYSTPNIHFCTVRDFEVLCHERGITILHNTVVARTRIDQYMTRWNKNLFGETAVYHLTR
ncbi:methionine biosynthesis protein MetW [Candidatus Endobugula sertula]|uniref:Methionine biosynthesis protein MetW n=1 Tax=Candidatus Endobugula sertula TaxID=62101 RepID=A0A1D2QSM1_9GAMM|nr:methionine biosynthesis protein MetW [Candidatus Endobugula sertula]